MMPSDKYEKLAIKYHLDDIRSASIIGGRLSKIINQVEYAQKPLSYITLNYLETNRFCALLDYANKKVSFTGYLYRAKNEQALRIKVSCTNYSEFIAKKKLAKQKSEYEKRKLEEQAKQVRLKQQRKVKEERHKANAPLIALKQRYDLSYFIDDISFPKLMDILRKVDNWKRLTEKEIIWLSTKGREYFTPELKIRFHKIEADFYVNKFKKSKNPWSAINASSHYRKCEESLKADLLLCKVNKTTLKTSKIKSAICTTHGGVKRDLGKWKDALKLGEKAHGLTPKDFRPCTLLGAVYMETGSHGEGQLWYNKAIKRGFKEESMDNELKSIYRCTHKSNQKELREHLLKIDSVRYNWVK